CFQADGWPDVNPVQTAIGNFAAGLADVLADGEIEIMWRHGQLSAADPELQQPGININHRRAPEVGQQTGTGGVMEIYQQVCPLKDGLGLRSSHVEVLCRRVRRRVLAVREVEDDFSA